MVICRFDVKFKGVGAGTKNVHVLERWNRDCVHILEWPEPHKCSLPLLFTRLNTMYCLEAAARGCAMARRASMGWRPHRASKACMVNC